MAAGRADGPARGTIGSLAAVPAAQGPAGPLRYTSAPLRERDTPGPCPTRGSRMTEILTESFCERCGTRYTFEAAIRKKRRIGKLKVLSRGLKNYVLSDDASLDEALAEARSDEQREVSGGQLDAFHQTFQFCMAGRQYTCSNCWNEAEGRCLSCAPLSTGAGPLRSPLDDLLAGGGMAPLITQHFDTDAPAAQLANGNGHASLQEPAPTVVGSAWPTIDLFRTTRAEPIVEP